MKAVHTPFSIVKENAYVPGCTVSQQLLMGPSAAFHAFPLRPVRISAQRPMPILSS